MRRRWPGPTPTLLTKYNTAFCSPKTLPNFNPDACCPPQAIIVAHSMGTLVAQYFLECMGGADVSLMHVAVGPPFRGSVLGNAHFL